MKKSPGSVLFLLLLVLYCDGTPLIRFKEVIWDFGTIPQMQAVKHVFEFSNDGEGTLFIKDIKADWGCTGILLSDKEIPAGGSGKIEISLNSGMRDGKVSKSIVVYTNDPRKDTVRLVVSATVVPKK